MEEGDGETSFVFFEFECCFGCGRGSALESTADLQSGKCFIQDDMSQMEGIKLDCDSPSPALPLFDVPRAGYVDVCVQSNIYIPCFVCDGT